MLAYAGRGNFVVEDIDLDALLHDMESLFSSAMPRKSECHIEVPPDLPAIRADKTQIRQLFMNLVTNSGEAMEENPGTVDVSLELVETHEGEPASVYTGQALKPGSYIQICVSDTGCGMDEETLKNLFDPFFSTKFQGRGLGMAAVLGIVRSYEGDVQVESEIGKGTKVTVRLPAEDHVVDENPVSNHNFEEEFVENAPEGIILLVDDEFVVRQVGTGMLERLGFDVVTAEDGLEGVNKFKELNERVLFVILDMTMPKMDGEEALRAMRAVRPEVPILISSGYTEQEILSRFSDEHISGFVSKPYSMKGLQTSTNQVIRELQASGRV
jgi:CheY-like chemotaxis protein/anti-sigma regulatory factor (Ser/Thr protein kinase)